MDHSIWIVAIRDIKKGEEIVYDYNFDISCYEDHPCRCGTSKCVGYIVGTEYRDELKEILKKKRKKEERRRRKKRKKGRKGARK